MNLTRAASSWQRSQAFTTLGSNHEPALRTSCAFAATTAGAVFVAGAAAQRIEGFRHRDDARTNRNRRAAQLLRVAAPVEPFARRADDFCRRIQERHAAQHLSGNAHV